MFFRLLENLLNSFVFDCIGEDNGEKCSQDSTPVRDALESPLLEHINLTFEAVQQKWSGYDGVQEGENQTSLEQLICETIYENLASDWSGLCFLHNLILKIFVSFSTYFFQNGN